MPVLVQSDSYIGAYRTDDLCAGAMLIRVWSSVGLVGPACVGMVERPWRISCVQIAWHCEQSDCVRARHGFSRVVCIQHPV